MSKSRDRPPLISRVNLANTQRDKSLRQADAFCLLCGLVATIVLEGLMQIRTLVHWELGLIVICAVSLITVNTAIRYCWSQTPSTFFAENRAVVILGLVWVVGFVGVLILGPALPEIDGNRLTRPQALLALSEIVIVLQAVTAVVSVTRRAMAGGLNPALILVVTFLVLVTLGTLLLMMPRAHSQSGMSDGSAVDRFRIALFTATSASCVTGLTIVPTGQHWSPIGQAIILCLFQIGGLGIMTCGALFAVMAGKQLQFRESAALRDLLESKALGDVRRLLWAVVGFTFASEFIGAVLLSGLFADLAFDQRLFQSVFHSVSAFCNAGFVLTDNSLVGRGTCWQVWGVVAGLVVTGGLGFAVLYNLFLVVRLRIGSLNRPPLFNLPTARTRLTLSSKLVLATTCLLLLVGTLGYHILESTGQPTDTTLTERMAEAWFQAVTFRTAGFNTVDHGELQPVTKLFAMLLMFVGASPGSTGGGVKTVAFALTGLALVSLLRGRRRVEIMGRTIPDEQIRSALTMISLGLFVVLSTSMLLVLFEPGRPNGFLDLLFEATSAFATVGVSTGITPELTEPSQYVIIVAMFLGRVGPLTLLLAMAGQSSEARYQFPDERVTLG